VSAQDTAGLVVSEEFFLKVNDVLESVNRIERRFDTHHAEIVILHAFARYSAHHYRSTTKVDGQEQRDAFADYMASTVRGVLANHIADLAGPAPVAAAAGENEPSAE
jgi:hypothetical protein